MKRFFAELDENKVVKRVIVADSLEFCEERFGGTWVETFRENPDKNYAGIGNTHDEVSQNFIRPKPFPSWSLDGKQRWQPPVPKDENSSKWDEENLRWKTIDEVKAEIAMVELEEVTLKP